MLLKCLKLSENAIPTFSSFNIWLYYVKELWWLSIDIYAQYDNIVDDGYIL
jgi:hypothetical protein